MGKIVPLEGKIEIDLGTQINAIRSNPGLIKRLFGFIDSKKTNNVGDI
jgi:hypothetical protein